MREVKIVAFHLPQFHTFPENDEWWGKGFTEWTNVRKAKPLYKGHNQPRVPLGGKYYDLSNLDSMLEQMKQAKEFGIFGFCYYHYWFNGKLLMEKPIEAIRDYCGEKLPYCLCWANEPWTRAWDGQDKEIIMPQEYGGENEWEQHYQYLKSFFQDPYYIKEKNKPFLVIYRSNNIPQCDDMISYWEHRCMEDGFGGLFLVEELNGFQNVPVCRHSSAILEFEPMYTGRWASWTKGQNLVLYIQRKLLSLMGKTNCIFFPYNIIWNAILTRDYSIDREKKTFLGAFTDWDNSPRKGKNATIFFGSTPQIFKKCMKKQLERCKRFDSEYLFINAWNEWAEGCYLEPDEKNGYGYLEALRDALEEVGDYS